MDNTEQKVVEEIAMDNIVHKVVAEIVASLKRCRPIPGEKYNPFVEPVDVQLYTDYTTYVKHPMAVATMEVRS